MGKLIETSPTTGDTIAAYETPAGSEVAMIVERSKRAFGTWGKLPLPLRFEYLEALKHTLVDDMQHSVDVVSATTGKVELEALTADVFTCIDMLHYYVNKGTGFLTAAPRESGAFFPRSTFHIEYMPLGVVAVIAPWNYPLQLSFVPTITALAAGNCVVIKTSEVTPSVGTLIEKLVKDAGLPEGVVQVVQGGPEVGRALIDARPDKIFFTGSVATGKKIMAAAAEQLIPVELELGGKDPLIVFADAPFERAVDGAVYGAFTNAGQTCVAVERVYVERPLYERFVTAAGKAAAKLRVGSGCESDMGPIIDPSQIPIIEAHLDDAVAKGATLVTRRRREGSFLHPVVLRDVDHTMKIMTEETFGPVMPIMPFDSESEVVDLANATVYGLDASVWTKDLDKGRRVASEIISGNCAINDVLKNIANPDLPFGGEKQSGLGRYHGPEGLRSFSRIKAVMVNEGTKRREINWYPYTETSFKAVMALIHAVYSDAPALKKARSILRGLLRSKSCS